MKLFVWSRPYHVNYGHSMVVAVAATVEKARAAASKGKCYSFGEYENGTPGPADLLKEPTRVVEVGRSGVAEWHEWSE